MTSSKITRRSILRGLGVSLAIPSLESFAVGGVSGIPLRMGFTYIPNGVIMDEWRPLETGPLVLSPIASAAIWSTDTPTLISLPAVFLAWQPVKNVALARA